MSHLWEIRHPFTGAKEVGVVKFSSFADLAVWVNDSDADLNLIYRWDWLDYSQPHFDGDGLSEEERSEEKFVVWIVLPRKYGFASLECPITKAQERDVLDWLRGPRVMGHLATLWAPLLDAVPRSVSPLR